MELMDAVYHRRSVRSYRDQAVDKATVEALIKAATQAPSAMNQQPWAFAVIQGVPLLARYSDRVKAHLVRTLTPRSPFKQYRDTLETPDFNVFYGAGTLIVICAKPEGLRAEEDCCLAAQNLMLAAYGMGLGTCPIGFARPWLNLLRVKRELGIPPAYKPVFPVIVGYPLSQTQLVTRREPEIVAWK